MKLNLPGSKVKSLFLASLCMALCQHTNAIATTTYRCENGKLVSYSDHPCASSTSSVQSLVKIDPANPTEADREAALVRAKQDRIELKKIETEQKKESRQSAAQQQKVQRQKQLQSRQCAKLELKVKHLKADVASASLREIVKKRTQLRRAEDNLALECSRR